MLFHLTGTIEDPEALGPYQDEEKRVFGQLCREGTVVHAFRRGDKPGIFLVVSADSLERAREEMARLPYVAEGLLRFEYLEVADMRA